MRDCLGSFVLNWKTSVEPGLMERQPHMKQKRVYLYSSGPVPAGQSIHNFISRRQAVTDHQHALWSLYPEGASENDKHDQFTVT